MGNKRTRRADRSLPPLPGGRPKEHLSEEQPSFGNFERTVAQAVDGPNADKDSLPSTAPYVTADQFIKIIAHEVIKQRGTKALAMAAEFIIAALEENDEASVIFWTRVHAVIDETQNI